MLNAQTLATYSIGFCFFSEFGRFLEQFRITANACYIFNKNRTPTLRSGIHAKAWVVYNHREILGYKGTNKWEEKQNFFEFSRTEVPSRRSLKGAKKKRNVKEKGGNLSISTLTHHVRHDRMWLTRCEGKCGSGTYFLQFFLHWPLCEQSLQPVSLQADLHSVHFLQSWPQPALLFLHWPSAFLHWPSAFLHWPSVFLAQQALACFSHCPSCFFSQHSFLFLSHLWSWALTVVVAHIIAMIIMAQSIIFFILFVFVV